MAQPEDLQDAEPQPNPASLDLPIGPPFALSNDCALLERDDAAGIPGCCACVSCDACSKPFRLNLLGSDFAKCPSCNVMYTHVLLVCRQDDEEMLADAARVIARSNGFGLPDEEEDDEREDNPDAEQLGGDDDDDQDDER